MPFRHKMGIKAAWAAIKNKGMAMQDHQEADSNPAKERPRASAPLVYPIEPPEPGGALQRIADGVLWARIPMPIALNHINVYLLRDTDGWVIIDTGLHHELSLQAWAKIATAPELEGLPFKALICTHFHYDHGGMAHWLCTTHGIPLYMSRAEHHTMRSNYQPFPAGPELPPTFVRFYGGAGVSLENLEKMAAFLRKDPFITDAQQSYIRLRRDDVLTIGQRQWRVLIGGGHSPEHVCLYCDEDAEQPLLLAGDQLISRISSNVPVNPSEPEANPMQIWLDSLDMLSTLSPKTWVMPAHQGVFTGLQLRTQELREHHAQQFDTMVDLLQQRGELTAAQVMEAIFPKLRNPIDQLLAVGEVVAHLHWLVHAGRAHRRLDDAAQVYRFAAGAAEGDKPLFGCLRVGRV